MERNLGESFEVYKIRRNLDNIMTKMKLSGVEITTGTQNSEGNRKTHRYNKKMGIVPTNRGINAVIQEGVTKNVR